VDEPQGCRRRAAGAAPRRVEPVEQALAVLGAQRGAERVGGGEPLPADRRQALAAPACQPAAKDSARISVKGRVRGAMPAAVSGSSRAVEPLGNVREIESEADHHRILEALEQDSGSLAPSNSNRSAI
jgi:hypothetical protein